MILSLDFLRFSDFANLCRNFEFNSVSQKHKQLGKGWGRQAEFCPCYIMDNRPNETIIPDRSESGLAMTAPTA